MAPTPRSVKAALRPFGRRIAGTPLAMASTPARAAPPPAKERSTTSASATAVRSVDRSTSNAALAATGVSPAAHRTRPVTTSTPTTRTKPYTGTMADQPASCRPRRLTTMTSTTAPTASGIRPDSSPGSTESRLSIAAAALTATVRV